MAFYLLDKREQAYINHSNIALLKYGSWDERMTPARH